MTGLAVPQLLTRDWADPWDVSVDDARDRRQLNVPRALLDAADKVAKQRGQKLTQVLYDAIRMFIFVTSRAAGEGETMRLANAESYDAIRRIAGRAGTDPLQLIACAVEAFSELSRLGETPGEVLREAFQACPAQTPLSTYLATLIAAGLKAQKR